MSKDEKVKNEQTEENINNENAESQENERKGEKHQSTADQPEEKTEGQKAGTKSDKESVESKEDELKRKYDELNDKYLRLYSDFENFRRRSAKEKLEMISNAGADTIKEILPVIDDFERAIASKNDEKSMAEGITLVYQKLIKTLADKGLKPMDNTGKAFDPEREEAVAKIPAPKKKLKGKVVDVVEKGYYLNDKILRHAKVVVGE